MLTLKEREQLMLLKAKWDDAKATAENFTHGYSNYSAEEVNLKLTKTRTAFNDYLNSITEKPMTRNQAFEEAVFTLKASVQTYELSIADLAQLIAGQLGVPVARLTISPRREFSHGDAIGEGEYIFAGLTVTVKNT